MFDFGVGYTEMFLIAVVAIIVIGPKDLPRVLRAFGKMMTKARGMARYFRKFARGPVEKIFAAIAGAFLIVVVGR